MHLLFKTEFLLRKFQEINKLKLQKYETYLSIYWKKKLAISCQNI